ncbi:MAG: fused MFS/spermidine synthase [Bryobacteraceae bacterium]
MKLEEKNVIIPAAKLGLRTRWFYAFFFISGFCSLIYEVVWLRLSMASFGVTTPMVSIVLSVFMTGLGLGSWLGGILMRRFERSSPAVPLRLYATLELIIGCSGFIAPALIIFGYHLLRDAGRSLAWGSSVYYLVSGAWILIALLPWTTCMGATFPFAMAAIRRLHGEGSEHSFSYLYLANVLGAVLGTLIPAFVLIELFGFRGTLYIASTLNALLALGVFALSSSSLLRSAEVTYVAEMSQLAKQPSRERGTLFLLFTTGLCSMAMEVVWVREYTVYLGNVVYAFATILAVYLAATFLGSYIYRRRFRSHETSSFGLPWLPLGLVALLPLLFADPRLPIPEVIDSTAQSLALGAIRAVFGIAGFSGLVGFLTPMLVDRWSGGSPELAGKAYGVNVVGSVVGPLVAGFWILPLAGERWGLVLMSLPLFTIGFVSATRASGSGFRMFKLRPIALFASTIAVSILLALVTRDYSTKYPRRVELRDHTATVIATGEGMHKRLLVNGTGMTKLTPITKLMAHMPLAFLDRPAKNALVICFGMGTTFRSMLSWGIDVTAIELVPSVPKLFGYFHPDGPALLKSSQAHIVIDDGRRYLERSNGQFDVIAADPPPPIGAPASSLLYSQEFYSILKPHLRSGGIVQVWCPGGDRATMASIAKSLKNAFPYVRGFMGIEGWGVHFLASMQPIPLPSPEELARRMPPAAKKDLLEWTPDSTATDIFDNMLSDEETLQEYITLKPSVPPIADDRPINEYFLLRSADPNIPI